MSCWAPVVAVTYRVYKDGNGCAADCQAEVPTSRVILNLSTTKETTLRVGMIGTGAISQKHALAYKNIGYQITVCTDISETYGRKFADEHGAEFVKTYEEVCRHPKVDYVDVCTFPDFRLQPIEICAQT